MSPPTTQRFATRSCPSTIRTRPGTSLSTNIDKTTHAGIEALVGASFAIAGDAHRLEPLLSMTLNDFSFDSDAVYGDNDLPAAPEYVVRGELLYRIASGFYAGPTFDFVGERFADFSNTYKVDSYQLLGLRGGFATDDGSSLPSCAICSMKTTSPRSRCWILRMRMRACSTRVHRVRPMSARECSSEE